MRWAAATITLACLVPAVVGQFGELVPYAKRVAVQCLPTNTADSDVRILNSTAAVYGVWTWIHDESAGSGSIMRFYNKSIRDPTQDIVRANGDCGTNTTTLSASFGVGNYSSTAIRAASSGLYQNISSFFIENGYMVTSYLGENLNGTSRQDIGRTANSDLCTNSTWNDAVGSFKVEDLRYFYIRSELNSFARVNNTFIDTAGTASLLIYGGWVWESFKLVNERLSSPWWGEKYLNCDSFGTVAAVTSSASASTIRVLVPTVAQSANTINTFINTGGDFRINMTWEHDPGYYLCNITFAAADTAVVGSISLLNCSSDSTSGYFNNVTVPHFFIRYTPTTSYSTTSGKTVSFTHHNGPFSFTSTFTVVVVAPSPSPSISISSSASPSASISVTATPSVSASPTISVTPSITPSISVTPSASASASITASVTPSSSVTPSASVSESLSSSASPSISESPSSAPSPSVEVSPTSLPQSGSSTSPETTSSTPTGVDAALIGGVVGGVAGFVLIAVVVAVVVVSLKKKERKKKNRKSAEAPFSIL